MKSYKELEVWQRAIELVTDIYAVSRGFPPSERYGLASQMQRAATSVPANIAEGWGRGSRKEYLQFLKIARGSLMELETHIVVANALGYISNPDVQRIEKKLESVAMMLNRLISRLNQPVTP
ncbi:MAG: four helix bundle protein [Acidobacteria bacterium RIFCSPLOWO2_12_FULL_60_22]|nr:MAG: four helix bundle protein [Acidobacteria bacterium RIFCSPLOWO2_12_FULL_60_22]